MCTFLIHPFATKALHTHNTYHKRTEVVVCKIKQCIDIAIAKSIPIYTLCIYMNYMVGYYTFKTFYTLDKEV